MVDHRSSLKSADPSQPVPSAKIYPWPPAQPEEALVPTPNLEPQSRILSGANVITFLRLLLIPFIAYKLLEGNYTATLVLFCIAALSDALDGLLARTLSLRTRIGGYLDPLADKLLLVTLFVCLALLNELPTWLTCCVISRDVLIMSGVGVFLWQKKAVSMAPALVSKINTLFELSLIFLILLRLAHIVQADALERLFIFLTLGTLALSTMAYIIIGYRLCKNQPPAA